MVTVSDGLGRPLYILDLDENKRIHPYTFEEVNDDFIHEYPGSGQGSATMTFFIAIAIMAFAFGLYFMPK